MQLDLWDRQSHHFLTSHLEVKKTRRSHLDRFLFYSWRRPSEAAPEDKKLLILVGYDERSKEQLAQKLLDEL